MLLHAEQLHSDTDARLATILGGLARISYISERNTVLAAYFAQQIIVSAEKMVESPKARWLIT